MTCEDCLSALATESLREMTPDSAVLQHCATCPDCARLTTMLRDKEYETATVLNSLPPMSNPLTVAETAVSTAQRRRTGRFVVMFSGVVGAVVIWIVAATMIVPALDRADLVESPRAAGAGRGQRTETMQLSCLSPQQAGDIIIPYLRSSGSRYYVPSSGLSAITVRGTPDELAKSRNLILEFEKDPSAACHLPMTIVRKLQEEMSKDQGRAGTEFDYVTGKPTTTLLGKPGEQLLDVNAPRGREPIVPPDKAPTAPKKQ